MKPNRTAIVRVISEMPDEAFGWLVLACRSSAATTGAAAQIWPDGLGGFTNESRRSISALRRVAQTYIDQAVEPKSKQEGR